MITGNIWLDSLIMFVLATIGAVIGAKLAERYRSWKNRT